jgi:hypothetical protein
MRPKRGQPNHLAGSSRAGTPNRSILKLKIILGKARRGARSPDGPDTDELPLSNLEQALTSNHIANEARELSALLAQSEGEREVIEAALLSVFCAMQRVAPSDRNTLQALVADFIANPDDRDAIDRLGALLKGARPPDH